MAALKSKSALERDGRFWDRIAARYAARPLSNPDLYARKLEVTRAYLTPEMEVLELGCGTGSTALAHAPHVRRIVATDMSENMLEIARRKAAEAGVSNVVFERMMVEELDARAQRFDAMLALSLVHLLEDRDVALRAMGRALKPGGVLVLNTVCLGDRMWWLRRVAPIGRWLGVLPRLRTFTADALMESLTSAGFDIERDWRPEKSVAVFTVARKRAERV